MTTKFDITCDADNVADRLESSAALLEWLSGELGRRSRACRSSGSAEGGPRDQAVWAEAARRRGRIAGQVAQVAGLVGLAIRQVNVHGDLGIAWILLEQSRQQLGHAWATVGASGETIAGDDPDVDPEVQSHALLTFFLQRDLMPWPGDAPQVVDFGVGNGVIPDFRPDAPVEMVSLQLLADAAMTFRAGHVVDDISDRVMSMAFGEHVWAILDLAMDLLEFTADDDDDACRPDALVDTGREAAHLTSGAFRPAWRVFTGPAGFPDAA